MITWVILLALIAIGIALCWQMYAIQRERDPTWRIHQRQQQALRNHHKAMRIWKARGKVIKPRKEWIA